MVKKKSYNPFKMRGSYAGVGIVGISLLIWAWRWNVSFKDILFLVVDLGYAAMFTPIAYLTLVIGFLIGWGIHSLFRRFRK